MPFEEKTNQPEPNLAAIEAYVDIAFSYLEGTVAVRSFPESTDARPERNKLVRLPFLTTGNGIATDILVHAKAASKSKIAAYVIPATTRGHGHAEGADILSMQTVLADLDTGDIAAKRVGVRVGVLLMVSPS